MKTVFDIMQTDLATIGPDATIQELTRFLAGHGISGAPVVDEAGALLGVVSATDVIRRLADEPGIELPAGAGGTASYYLPEEREWGSAVDWDTMTVAAPADALTVADIMTPVTFSVDPATTLQEVSDFLVRGRIHRALVLDGTRLVGLVSAMDILRVVASGD